MPWSLCCISRTVYGVIGLRSVNGQMSTRLSGQSTAFKQELKISTSFPYNADFHSFLQGCFLHAQSSYPWGLFKALAAVCCAVPMATNVHQTIIWTGATALQEPEKSGSHSSGKRTAMNNWSETLKDLSILKESGRSLMARDQTLENNYIQLCCWHSITDIKATVCPR